jgi:hypothetical protein
MLSVNWLFWQSIEELLLLLFFGAEKKKKKKRSKKGVRVRSSQAKAKSYLAVRIERGRAGKETRLRMIGDIAQNYLA